MLIKSPILIILFYFNEHLFNLARIFLFIFISSNVADLISAKGDLNYFCDVLDEELF